MQNKSSLLIMALSFPLIALLIWTIALHMQIKDDQSVIIAVEGYDPRDLLRGHYVNLSLYWDATDMTQFQNSNCRQADFKKTYRYYLDENDGPALDKLINQLRPSMSLEFSCPDAGSPHIKHFYIEGQPFDNWLAQHS